MFAVSVKLPLFKNKSFAGFVRLYSSDKHNVAYKYNKFDPNHHYEHLYPWKTRDEFVDAIEKSIVYNQDGLVAINKPFGVPIDVPKSRIQNDDKPRTIKQTLVTCDIPECQYSMAEVLPILKTRLNLSSLLIVKSPERYTSGIILLASSEANANKISRALKRSQAKQLPAFNYWALTTFIPQANQKLKKVGIRLIEVKEFNEKVPIIEPKASNRAIKNDVMTSVLVKTNILTINNLFNTALVEVEASKTKMHFLRVYMAYQLAPILGDGMYSSRVKSVLGKPVTVSPFNKAAYDKILLSDNLSRQLQVPKNKIESIPTHLHLHQVTLDGYANKQDLILNCSPPQYFTWSLSRLGLELDPQIQTENMSSN